MWLAAFVEIKKPFDVVYEIFFKVLKLADLGVELFHSMYLSTHEIRGTHEIMFIKLLIVLRFNGVMNVRIEARANFWFWFASSFL